jgi:hypothetical protein
VLGRIFEGWETVEDYFLSKRKVSRSLGCSDSAIISSLQQLPQATRGTSRARADTILHIDNLVPQTRCDWSDYSGYT